MDGHGIGMILVIQGKSNAGLERYLNEIKVSLRSDTVVTEELFFVKHPFE
jgi:hypothetical protein